MGEFRLNSCDVWKAHVSDCFAERLVPASSAYESSHSWPAFHGFPRCCRGFCVGSLSWNEHCVND